MAYKMTPARRAALKKAQAASARKRRGKGKGKLASAHRKSRRNARIALGVSVAAVGALAYTNYQMKSKAARNKGVSSRNAARVRTMSPTAKASAMRRDYTSTKKPRVKQGSLFGSVTHNGKQYNRRELAKQKQIVAAMGTSGSKYRRFVSGRTFVASPPRR